MCPEQMVVAAQGDDVIVVEFHGERRIGSPTVDMCPLEATSASETTSASRHALHAVPSEGKLAHQLPSHFGGLRYPPLAFGAL